MAYTQNPGRSPLLKTGNGIPSALLQKVTPKKPVTKPKSVIDTAKDYATKAVNTVKNVASKTGEAIVKGGTFLAEAAEGQHGSSGYSQSDESMRQKNQTRFKEYYTKKNNGK